MHFREAYAVGYPALRGADDRSDDTDHADARPYSHRFVGLLDDFVDRVGPTRFRIRTPCHDLLLSDAQLP